MGTMHLRRTEILKKYIKLAIGMLFTIIFLFFSYKSIGELDLRKVVTYPVNYFLVALSILFFIAAQWFRSLAWSRGMGRGFKTIQVFKAVCIGMAVNMVVPFRMGEALRIAVLGGTKDASYSRVGVNIILERLMDVVILICLAVSTLFFTNFGIEIEKKIIWLRNLAIAGIVFGVAITGILRWLYLNSKSQPAWLVKLLGYIEKAGLIKSPKVILYAGFYLLLSWLCVYICTLLGILSVGAELGKALPASLTVLTMTNLAMLIPAAPGGIGVFQYACIYSLELYKVASIQAAVLAILLHLIQYAAMLPLGFYYFITGKYSLKKIQSSGS
jgi:hypothetical protein